MIACNKAVTNKSNIDDEGGVNCNDLFITCWTENIY